MIPTKYKPNPPPPECQTPAAQPYVHPLTKSVTTNGADIEAPPTAPAPDLYACAQWAVLGKCANGHQWAKELVCGREWCPTCGQDDSVAHKRRTARWTPRAQQIASMGYLVITIPPSARWQLTHPAHLRFATKALLDVLRGHRTKHERRVDGYWPRGLARWHWFGEKPGIFHPHLNVLVDGGYLPRHTLRQLKRDLAKAVKQRDLVVYYQYSRKPAKKAHWTRYVNRPTFTDRSWAPDFIETLYNFHSSRSWGKWEGQQLWGDSDPHHNHDSIIAALETHTCPICHSPVEWTRPRRLSDLRALVPMAPVGAGYHYIMSQAHPRPPPMG